MLKFESDQTAEGIMGIARYKAHQQLTFYFIKKALNGRSCEESVTDPHFLLLVIPPLILSEYD